MVLLWDDTSEEQQIDTGKGASCRDNNTIFMVKPGYQTSMMPYSTDNRSNLAVSLSLFV